MSLPKILIALAIILFGVIGVATLTKKGSVSESNLTLEQKPPQIEVTLQDQLEEAITTAQEEPVKPAEPEIIPSPMPDIPQETQDAGEETLNIDRVQEFFNKKSPQLPIVQTITYKSRVPWLKGRQAWVADYSSHYKTSRHFIARSLNGKPEYEKQDVADGDKFNVFREDKDIQFYLLVNLSACKMRFYYLDADNGDRVLIKTYPIGVGRRDENSKCLTPVGKYTLGDKTAIYKPNLFSYHHGVKTEMIQVFGTRWIPFGEALEGTTTPPQGFGIHGLPWHSDGKGELAEDAASLGKQQSDGCIRLSTKDVEELFAIIISRPTIIELVN